MKWEPMEPQTGDMIRVKVGPLYHYGIFLSDDRVIQFGLNPVLRRHVNQADITVCVSDIDQFLCGEFLQVGVCERQERRKRFSLSRTAALAESRLGEHGYHILYNNCEHFVYECAFGEHYCSQTESVRDLFRHMPVADLYIAALPDKQAVPVACAAGQQYIAAAEDDHLRLQRCYEWKLLEYALHRSFGRKAEDIAFEQTADGGWSCPEYGICLSHHDGALAVAVSRAPIGVSIGAAEDSAQCARKAASMAGVTPTDTRSGRITVSGKDYGYAVASKDITRLRLYPDIAL